MTAPVKLRCIGWNDPPRYALVVGDRDAWLAPWLERQLDGFADRVELASDPAAAAQRLAESPDASPLVVLSQERPGALPADLPRRLRQAAPSAELLSVAGTWCEGELRTGQPWDGVERVYWYAVEPWLRQWADRKSADLRTEGGAPRRHHVAIDAADRETAAALAGCLDDEGHSAVWLPRGGSRPLATGFSAGLWVAGQLDGIRAATLAHFCRQLRRSSAPVVTLLDFPRRDEVRLARALGAAAVLPKPWRADALTGTIERLGLAPAEQAEQAAPSRAA